MVHSERLNAVEKRIRFLFAAALIALSTLSVPGHTRAEGLSFIRDAEIERMIRLFSTPVFEAAGLSPQSVEVYLVKDDSINAFVAGGQKLFLHTGLLLRSESAGQVIGVIAHEAGHMAGGHLSRTHEQLRNSTAQSILAFVLGGAAALGTGRGDLGSAIIMGGQQLGERSFLQYSRTQEYAADQAAMRFLDDAGISSRGLMDFLEILEGDELLSASRQSPYARTHPMSRERVAAVEQHVARSSLSNRSDPAGFAQMHARMKAKLSGFLEPAAAVFRRYPQTETSVPARYAHAIAFYRRGELDKAVAKIDGLLKEFPEDPFFHELRGQMLFESGHLADALPSYERAVALYGDSALLRGELGRVQIESEDPALLKPAIQNLKASLRYDSDRPFTWRLLAIAYGRDGQMGESALAMAEEAFHSGRPKEARYYAGKAEKELSRGSPGWLRAQDILAATDKEQTN